MTSDVTDRAKLCTTVSGMRLSQKTGILEIGRLFTVPGATVRTRVRPPTTKMSDINTVTNCNSEAYASPVDELPQFWNVLRGDMSLVGPRPPLAYEVEKYKQWHCRRVLEAKPGITGLWQVTGRSRTTFDEMVRLDLRYARKRVGLERHQDSPRDARRRRRWKRSGVISLSNEFACVAPDVKLGRNVRLGKFINLYGCEVGDDTKIGAFVEIQKNASVGERCKISSHTFICEGVTIEDEVFIGHGVMFVNDSFPRATTAHRKSADRSRLEG